MTYVKTKFVSVGTTQENRICFTQTITLREEFDFVDGMGVAFGGCVVKMLGPRGHDIVERTLTIPIHSNLP